MNDKIKTYKGVNKDLTAYGGFQYEQGKEYECDGNIAACSNGFHACERPLDVLSYYPPASSRYFEVEQCGELSRENRDSKVASRKIKIGAEIGIPGLVKAHIEYVKAHTTIEYTDPRQATAGDRGAATAGDRGAATAGDSGAATAGDVGAATAGYRGAATAGDSGAATAGNFGAATAGNFGAATAGDSGAATAGDSGAATAGDFGAATSRGCVTVGKNGCGLVRSNEIKARGGIGSILVFCVENQGDFGIKEWKVVEVDGEDIKADTWYTLKDGLLVEVEE